MCSAFSLKIKALFLIRKAAASLAVGRTQEAERAAQAARSHLLTLEAQRSQS